MLSFIFCLSQYPKMIWIAFLDYKFAINCWSAICIWSFIIPVFEFLSSFFIICLITQLKCFRGHADLSPASLWSLNFIHLGYFCLLWVIRFELRSSQFFSSFRQVSFHIWVGTSWGPIKDSLFSVIFHCLTIFSLISHFLILIAHTFNLTSPFDVTDVRSFQIIPLEHYLFSSLIY